MRAAATLILISSLCFSCSRSTPEGATSASNEVSQAFVGKQITIRGTFSLRGKVGPYIALDNQQVVYLEATKGSFTWGKPHSEMEGKIVAATGTLRFYHEPPISQPAGGAVAVQRVSDHFYFDAETAQVRIVAP